MGVVPSFAGFSIGVKLWQKLHVKDMYICLFHVIIYIELHTIEMPSHAGNMERSYNRPTPSRGGGTMKGITSHGPAQAHEGLFFIVGHDDGN